MFTKYLPYPRWRRHMWYLLNMTGACASTVRLGNPCHAGLLPVQQWGGVRYHVVTGGSRPHGETHD